MYFMLFCQCSYW